MNTKPRKTKFGGKRRLGRALVNLLFSGAGRESKEFAELRAVGFTSGKHNGRTVGAFGGTKRAKLHRRCYVGAA